jgi:hypothetical protein
MVANRALVRLHIVQGYMTQNTMPSKYPERSLFYLLRAVRERNVPVQTVKLLPNLANGLACPAYHAQSACRPQARN